MKYKSKFLPLVMLSLIVLGTSCTDRRMNNMAEDRVFLNNFGLNPQNIYKWENFTYELQVVKSGIGQREGNVTLHVDETLLTKLYGTKYTLLPAQYYKVRDNVLNLTKSDYRTPFEIEFDAEGIETLQNSSNLIYAVPFKLTSSASLQPANEGQLYSVVVPTIVNPYLEFKVAGMSRQTVGISNAGASEETKFYAFMQTNYHNKADVQYKVVVDESVLTAYNLEKKTTHKMIPADAFKIDAASFTVAKLNNEQAFAYYLLKNKAAKGTYMLPLRLTEVSQHGVNPAKSTMLIPISIQD